jgi:hypothetical protein
MALPVFGFIYLIFQSLQLRLLLYSIMVMVHGIPQDTEHG